MTDREIIEAAASPSGENQQSLQGVRLEVIISALCREFLRREEDTRDDLPPELRA